MSHHRNSRRERHRNDLDKHHSTRHHIGSENLSDQSWGKVVLARSIAKVFLEKNTLGIQDKTQEGDKKRKKCSLPGRSSASSSSSLPPKSCSRSEPKRRLMEGIWMTQMDDCYIHLQIDWCGDLCVIKIYKSIAHLSSMTLWSPREEANPHKSDTPPRSIASAWGWMVRVSLCKMAMSKSSNKKWIYIKCVCIMYIWYLCPCGFSQSKNKTA